MGNGYPNKQETLDDLYLAIFNTHMKFFKEIPQTRETEQYSTIDRQLTDRNNRIINVELKTRFCDINTFDGLFIADKKWDALKFDYINKNIIPLYINFFYDYRNILIFDLRQYFDNKQTQPQTKYVTINNWGYNRIDENQLRYILPQRHGIFYQFDKKENKYIKKW